MSCVTSLQKLNTIAERHIEYLNNMEEYKLPPKRKRIYNCRHCGNRCFTVKEYGGLCKHCKSILRIDKYEHERGYRHAGNKNN
jgi:hypothetical protein